jgi:hypothetical protein
MLSAIDGVAWSREGRDARRSPELLRTAGSPHRSPGRDVGRGVAHGAAPTREHQRILDELIAFLLPLVKRGGRGTLHSGINVFDEASPKLNYRIPI